ncbi:hypothetical protein L6452_28602 [Arctium lappa]|uniref:Uncharacterized protein n=1 Tax=Arctium lappa TaxID=4217 RepID=A0ACB8ZZR7_ARCLA|nr:hypothetical protein L6452_28602 [Arctium lappa]
MFAIMAAANNEDWLQMAGGDDDVHRRWTEEGEKENTPPSLSSVGNHKQSSILLPSILLSSINPFSYLQDFPIDH